MRRTLVAMIFAASTLTAGPAGLFEPLWRLLSALWGEPAAKEGCGWDPNGLCAPAPPQSDEGAGWDPFGQPKAGAGWDPSGQPAPPPSDAGAGWDPNG
jgi:hypothetical protein